MAEQENESGHLLFKWRFAVLRSELPAPSKLVLHTLGFFMDMDGANCQIGLTRLRRETSLCVSTIKSHLSNLEAAGWVRVERSLCASGDPDANRYYPAIPTGLVVGQEMAGVGQDVAGGRPSVDRGVGQEMAPTSKSTSKDTSKDVLSVFKYWHDRRSEIPNTKKAKPTQKRLSKVQARLRDGHTVEDLKLAVDGCLANEFNVRGGYIDLELICRDDAHVTQYIAWARNPKEGGGDTPYTAERAPRV